LWPAWLHLISQCQPATILGEQVNAAIRHGWIDLVRADLEAQGYAFGFAVPGAHSVGAPHIRQRCYFVAESMRESGERRAGSVLGTQAPQRRAGFANGYLANRFADGSEAGIVADTDGWNASTERQQRSWQQRQQPQDGCAVRLAFAASEQFDGSRDARGGRRESANNRRMGNSDFARLEGRQRSECAGELSARQTGLENWESAEWLKCRDDKSRPVEPGTFPLAHGIPGRVGRLRAYGNAIVPQLAAQFIRAYIEAA
jgi:DNA (cytosine-5)-methyltransferase 1